MNKLLMPSGRLNGVRISPEALLSLVSSFQLSKSSE